MKRLLLTLLLSTALIAPASAANARADEVNGLSEITSPGSIQRKVAWTTTTYSDGSWATCSASLVGAKVLVTAAHCLRSSSGTKRPIKMRVEIGRHWSSGVPRYTYRCEADRYWAGKPDSSGFGDGWGGQDFALFSVANCKTTTGRYVPRPGVSAGAMKPLFYPRHTGSGSIMSAYYGYPEVYSTPGHLQRVLGWSRECDVDYNQADDDQHANYVCYEYNVQGGGSGGPLMSTRAEVVFGVAHVNYTPADGGPNYTSFTLFSLGQLTAINEANRGHWDLSGLGRTDERGSATYGAGGRLKVKPRKPGKPCPPRSLCVSTGN